MTTGASKPSNVAIAALIVDADHCVIQVNDALVDTGGSKNLASRHLLKNIKLAKSYENEPIRMVTVNGLSLDYNHQGELHTTDENGTPLVFASRHLPVLRREKALCFPIQKKISSRYWIKRK